MNYIIKKEDTNKKIKEIIKNKLFISNNLLKKLKDTNSILVNKNNVFINYIAKENDKIEILLDNIEEKKFSNKFKLVDIPFDILYEDEYLLIVSKPSNMPIHPSNHNYENTLSNIVASYLEKKQIFGIHILTRLDTDTSGICIFAKSMYIQDLFNKKKSYINLTKEYIALVNGIVQKKHDIIEKKIGRDKNSIILRKIDESGEYAKTEYYKLYENKNQNYSVLSIILHTGKTHQIRVHMASIGHVLLGDDLYANVTYTNNFDNIMDLISRQALHSFKISFKHPILGKIITIKCKIPKDIQKLIPID
ncbi:MAG: RluA family pseudouridine synthase [Clostridia bacterium]